MRDLTTGSIHKNFLRFSIPIILSSILSTAFGLIDTSIAGLFLGAKGLAALGATVSFFTLGESIFYGLTYGVSIAIAKMFGAQKYSRLKSVFYSNALLTIGLSSLLAIIFIPLWRPVFSFLNVESVIEVDARNYYFCLCLHMLPSTVNFYCTSCSNSIGETTYPLYLSIIGSLLNVGGNLLAVTVLDLGVLGLGLATLLSSYVVMLLHLLRFRTYFKKMGIQNERYRFRAEHITSVLSYSLPNIFQQSSMYVAGLLMSPIRNALGYTAIAAMSIVSRIQLVHSTIYYASARTAGNYASQCIGAKKYHKIRPAIGVAMLQACMFFVPLLIAMWLFPHAVCSIFIDESAEPGVVSAVLLYIKRFLPFILFNMICAVFHSIFRGVKSNHHLIISSMLSAIVNLIASFLLAPMYGITGLYISSAMSWITECLYILAVYCTGIWVPKEIRKKVLRSPKKEAQAAVISS